MLDIYDDCGFKYFKCYPDKKPNTPGFWPDDDLRKKYDKKSGEEIPNGDWMQPENQIDTENALSLQITGEMIGAHIPRDIVVIDLDRHEGKPDGVEAFKALKKQLSLNIDFISDTTVVQTGGGGYHVFFYAGKNHDFKQGPIKVGGEEIGIDIKTNSGYLIAAGSPGYQIMCDAEPMEIPEVLKTWLIDISKKTKKEKKKKPEPSKLIPVSILKSVLKKLDVKKFDSEAKWYDLIVSAIAAAGDSEEVIGLLSDWSSGDPNYPDCSDRIRSFEKEGDITVGTFIHILKENEISQYMINKIKNHSASLEIYENLKDNGKTFPFPEPDYNVISESKEASELFITCGNSVAATLLGFSIQGHVIWSEQDKNFYFFDGNKWTTLHDVFSIIYTILIRLTKFMYGKRGGGEADSENFLRLIKTINKTNWKRETANELKVREGVFVINAPWDSENIKETITTTDGVIDFSESKTVTRKGTKEEYRLSCVPYTTAQIMEAKKPRHYNDFLSGLFPDKETLFTARQAISMFISGNARKVFQVYHGGGDNGKSTLLEIESELLGGKSYKYDTSIIVTNKYSDDKMPPDAADFRGKYLLFGQEVEKGKRLSLGKIKGLTGDDTVNARALYKMPISFRPTWQMVFSCNDLPFFDGGDNAFIGRLLILPFERRFVPTEKMRDELINKGFDPILLGIMIDGNKLKKEIKKEYPAIIKQKIDDYTELKQKYNGMIQQSEKCLSHKVSYVSDNNDVETFLQEMCIVSPNSTDFETTEDICNAFHEYTGDSKSSTRFIVKSIMRVKQEITKGIRVVSTSVFSGTLGYEIDTKKQKRGLNNIRLKSVYEIEKEQEEKDVQ